MAAFHASPVVSTSSWVRQTGRALQLAVHLQPELPAELMREQYADGLDPLIPPVRVDPEQVSEFPRGAVPVGPLKDVEGHGGGL